MSTDTFARVRSILARHLEIPEDSIAEDSGLADLGLDSLGSLEFVFDVEEEFKVSVPDDRLPEFKSVRAVCEGIETLLATGPGRS
jgi:acyl carrier protein